MDTIPNLSSDILALSLDGPSSPTLRISLSDATLGSHPYGWGFGWYPGNNPSAMIAKDPAARGTQVLMEALTDWSNFRSSVFFCKVRGANKGYTHTETQPFSRSFAGRDWLFLHNGNLDKVALEKLHLSESRFLEPNGNTDSELAFCILLAQIQGGQERVISDIPAERLLSWFRQMDPLGSSDMVITDGRSVACFRGTRSPKPMGYARLQPPNNQGCYRSETAEIALSDPRDTYRTALVFSSCPLSDSLWHEMQPGQLIIARGGAVVYDSAPFQSPRTVRSSSLPPPAQQQEQTTGFAAIQAEQAQENVVTDARAITHTAAGDLLTYRVFEVNHTTQYDYSAPVERSTHLFRLQPALDPLQELMSCTLAISSPGEKTAFEDVFGNQTIHCVIETPYQQLKVECSSRVKVFAAPPDDHSLVRRQNSIPLVWMPWQRQMMMPYLLPSELPEDQLRELTNYAMGFVERNDYHLLKTIEDMNLSIYRDYQYVPGSTSLKTTVFEVYTGRQGVCQDFANLLICLTRLLSIPARYRMGYIYTGANYANKIQSEASHAWVEVYLPYVGWRGFDPTNGCMVTQDHVRVACGRNYGDATPTSGTIYKGGGTETLRVDVKMREILGET